MCCVACCRILFSIIPSTIFAGFGFDNHFQSLQLHDKDLVRLVVPGRPGATSRGLPVALSFKNITTQIFSMVTSGFNCIWSDWFTTAITQSMICLEWGLEWGL